MLTFLCPLSVSALSKSKNNNNISSSSSSSSRNNRLVLSLLFHLITDSNFGQSFFFFNVFICFCIYSLHFLIAKKAKIHQRVALAYYDCSLVPLFHDQLLQKTKAHENKLNISCIFKSDLLLLLLLDTSNEGLLVLHWVMKKSQAKPRGATTLQRNPISLTPHSLS